MLNNLDKFLLFVALPGVVIASLAEAIVLARLRSYDWRASAVSLFDLFARVAVQIFLPLSIAAPLITLAYRNRIGQVALDGPTALLALFIGQEFCYYWFHRAAHRVRWFWCNHAVHHSANELNLSAAYRIGILSRATGSSVFYVPLIWLGFEPRIVFEVLSLNLLYQFWIHATWIPRLGWLEYVLNTPSAHRVHHAANLEYLDANYGGVLIVFDRLFGTYRRRARRRAVPLRSGRADGRLQPAPDRAAAMAAARPRSAQSAKRARRLRLPDDAAGLEPARQRLDDRGLRARAAAQSHGDTVAPAKPQAGSEAALAGSFVATTF